MSRPETIEEMNEEAELVVSIARLIRGLEGAKDWAARSGAIGLEQWCSEALSPTGKLDVFPIVVPPVEDPKDAQIKALADALVMFRRDFHVCSENQNDCPHCVATDALRLAGRL